VVHAYRYEACPCCDGRLRDSEEPAKVRQLVELAAQPVVVEEHRQIAQTCTRCKQMFYHPVAVGLQKAGLFGPQLTALVGFMKGACRMSFSTIRKFFLCPGTVPRAMVPALQRLTPLGVDRERETPPAPISSYLPSHGTSGRIRERLRKILGGNPQQEHRLKEKASLRDLPKGSEIAPCSPGLIHNPARREAVAVVTELHADFAPHNDKNQHEKGRS